MGTLNQTVLILGCGYTGQRVARDLLQRGIAVVATTRDPERPEMLQLAEAGAKLLRFDVADASTFATLQNEVAPRTLVVHSLPTIGEPGNYSDATPAVLKLLEDRPSRMVYLSTTGVYGDTRDVDESTPVSPTTDRQHLRVAAEQAVLAGPWTSLVLRPAAIYGQGRGVHVRLRAGTFKLLQDGSNFISRIHVHDLARIAQAALFSDLTGAYPVADDAPCSSREIVAFCADLLGLPMPPSAGAAELDETRRSDRRVDGRAIRRLLGVELEYPTYREGITAAIEEENR